MRRQGEAIVRHLTTCIASRSTSSATRRTLTEVERDASVGTVLIEWGDKGEAIDTARSSRR
jgi:hypothetical protein